MPLAGSLKQSNIQISRIKEGKVMNKSAGKNYEVNQDSPLYHETYKLLRNYRDAMWNLELDVQHVKWEFEIEYGNSIDEFLESIYLAGADLGGSKLENYARSIERSNKMLMLLNSAIDLMRNKHKFGEQYYWILYYTFLSPSSSKTRRRLWKSCARTLPISPIEPIIEDDRRRLTH